MTDKKENTQTQNTKVDTSIYSEDNLITGADENNSKAQKQFEPWYKVKIQGKVSSYKVHSDGSLQIKFQEEVEKTISGTTFTDLEDRSVRIRKENPIDEKEAQGYLNKTVEIIDVVEKEQYKKISDANYDFSKPIGYFYSADNIKVIANKVANNYQLFKIFALKVKQVIPAVVYDKKKRTQAIDKSNSVILYEVTNDTLVSLHKITVKNWSFERAKELIDKEIVVLDLEQGTQNYCSKIKLK